MKFAGFFNPIELRLITPDPASSAALWRTTRGWRIRNPERAGGALNEAASAHEYLPLANRYVPPKGINHVAIAKEGGVCDVVRCRWLVGASTLELAQTHHILSLRVGPCPFDLTGLEAIRACVLELFVPGVGLVLDEAGSEPGAAWGEQNVAAAGQASTWPHWRDKMRWWYEHGDVGFVTLKADGSTTREIISSWEDLNRTWFSGSKRRR